MLLSRRRFLKTSAGVAILGRSLRAAEQRLGPIGIQLYTVREELQKDFEGTLAKLAAIGYKELEFAGYNGLSPLTLPANLRTIVRRHGLDAVSAHAPYGDLADRWPRVIETAHTIGLQYLVINSIGADARTQPGVWQRAADQLNRAGEACKAADLGIAYHNHMFEFAKPQPGERLPYEILAESTDPSLVSLQMDLCWMIAAGQQPETYFGRYPGRFSSVHVKDLKRLPVPQAGEPPSGAAVLPDLTDVGLGVLDWNTLLTQSWAAGVRHYFVEHDQPLRPMDTAINGYRHLAALRLTVP